jgi:hypothetical protein
MIFNFLANGKGWRPACISWRRFMYQFIENIRPVLSLIISMYAAIRNKKIHQCINITILPDICNSAVLCITDVLLKYLLISLLPDICQQKRTVKIFGNHRRTADDLFSRIG